MKIKKYSNLIYLGLWFVVAVLAFVSNICRFDFNISTTCYLTLLMAWAFFIRHRITRADIRGLLLAVAVLLMALFLFRLLRYNMTLIQRIGSLSTGLWYAYYIPFTAVPLLAYAVSACIKRGELDGLHQSTKWLFILEVFLCLLLLTNDLHGWLFSFEDIRQVESEYTYGWLYVVVVLWGVGFTLAAFVQMMRNCSISAARSRWYVPVVPTLAGVGLMAWYFACGSSPVVLGVNFYNLQEVFAFLFGFFRKCS